MNEYSKILRGNAITLQIDATAFEIYNNVYI